MDWQDEEAILKRLYRTQKDANVKPCLHLLWLVRSGKQVKEATAVVGCYVARRNNGSLGIGKAALKRFDRKKVAMPQTLHHGFLPIRQEALLAQANQEDFESGSAEAVSKLPTVSESHVAST